jgi:hypothetical protein
MKLYLSEGTTAYRKRTLVFAYFSSDLYAWHIPGRGEFGK